jgi:hypothetical protein
MLWIAEKTSSAFLGFLDMGYFLPYEDLWADNTSENTLSY